MVSIHKSYLEQNLEWKSNKNFKVGHDKADSYLTWGTKI